MRFPSFLICTLILGTIPSNAMAEAITSSSFSKTNFNRADCDSNEDLIATWGVATSTAATSYTLTLELHDATVIATGCPTGLGSTGGEQLESINATNNLSELEVTFSVSLNDIFNSDTCGDPGERDAKALCLYVKDQSNINVANDGVLISFDTISPTNLEVSGIQAGDEKFQFEVSGGDPNGNKVLSYVVSYRSCESEAVDLASDGGTPSDAGGAFESVDAGDSHFDAGASPLTEDGGLSIEHFDAGDSHFHSTDSDLTFFDGGSDDLPVGNPMTDARDGGTIESLCDAKGDFQTLTASAATISITGLNNDEKYEFKVYAVDDFDNAGPESELYSVTPINEVSVMDMYDGEPNPWGFSCQQSTSLPFYAFFLFSIVCLFRRNKKYKAKSSLLSIVFLWGLSYAPTSHADVGQISFSLNGGFYQPAIDTEIVDDKPIFPIYDCFFDNETLSLLHLDFGYRFLEGFGNFQVGMGLGYAQARGSAQTADILTTGTCGEASSGSVALHLMEFRPYVAYYFDQMYVHWAIPFVPYVKGGLSTFLYGWTHDGELDRSGEAEGNYATGLRPAIDSSAGVLMSLDWLEPAVTRRARSTGSYENAYALAEVAYVSTKEFELAGLVLSASDLYWDTNEPIMVRFGIMVEFP